MQFEKRWLCIIFTFMIFRDLSGSPHTAVILLQTLVNEEFGLVKLLRRYIFTEHRENRIVPDNIKTVLAYIEPISNAAIQNPHYAENPINAFHLVQRYIKNWEEVFDVMFSDDCVLTEPVQEFRKSVTTLKSNVNVWPTDVDAKGLSRALFRLWIVYDLDLVDLFNGKIYDEQAEPLSTSDVLLIARYADDDNMFYYEIKWLEKYSQIMHYIEEDEAMKLKVYKALAALYNRYGMPTKAMEIVKPYLQGNVPFQVDYEFYQRHKTDMHQEETEVKFTVDGVTRKYHSLCRGNIKFTRLNANLKCFFRKTVIPFYKSKEEVASYNPRISLFHDVISDEEGSFIKNTGKQMLDPSIVVGVAGDTLNKYRVSNTAWLNDTEFLVLQKIVRRVGLITGLNTQFKDRVSDVEKLQVLNYGVGGMYTPHLDFLVRYYDVPHVKVIFDKKGYNLWGPPDYSTSPELVGTGDRIATWMFYLKDVKAGGATVFPKLNVRIPVVKGAAAFWYNFKPSGEPDQRTLHAGCPVLLGSKWVANKWIRQSGQVFTRLCGKLENSNDDFPEI